MWSRGYSFAELRFADKRGGLWMYGVIGFVIAAEGIHLALSAQISSFTGYEHTAERS